MTRRSNGHGRFSTTMSTRRPAPAMARDGRFAATSVRPCAPPCNAVSETDSDTQPPGVVNSLERQDETATCAIPGQGLDGESRRLRQQLHRTVGPEHLAPQAADAHALRMTDERGQQGVAHLLVS